MKLSLSTNRPSFSVEEHIVNDTCVSSEDVLSLVLGDKDDSNMLPAWGQTFLNLLKKEAKRNIKHCQTKKQKS